MPSENNNGGGMEITMNNCLCNIFDDKCVWLIIIALLVIFCSCGDTCGNSYRNSNGCGCG